MTRFVMLLLSALAAGTAFAQGEGRNDPRSPQAAVPPPQYRSAFEDYRAYREQGLASWREANEEVGRVGGHIGVLKAEQEGKQENSAAEVPAHMHHHGGGR